MEWTRSVVSLRVKDADLIACVTALFFALEIIRFFSLYDNSIGRGRLIHLPFPAVRIVARFADWIVCDHIINEVFLAGIAKLMGFVRSENQCVSRHNFRCTILMTNAPLPGDD